MESLLKVPVQPALEHALPFRIVFEEYRRRRPEDLRSNAGTVLRTERRKIFQEAVDDELVKRISLQESRYALLAEGAAEIAAGVRRISVDKEVRQCHKADRPLLRILHLMDSSAICLSGGGIRSATISLGVLEGLSRYSRRSQSGVMRNLDYLSTVSGGGYMGSWMMAWIYRQMHAEGETKPLQSALASVEDALRELRAPDGAAPDWTPNADCLVELLAGAEASVRSWEGKNPAPPWKAEMVASVEGGSLAGLAAAATAAGAPMNVPGAMIASSALQKALQAMLAAGSKKAYDDVLQGLAGMAATTAGDPEPQPVRRLRSYTSYLAPDLGLTLDTFTLAAIMLRNLVVNWAMLVPVILCVIAGLELSGAVMGYVHKFHAAGDKTGTIGLVIAEVLLFAASAWFAGRGLPSHAERNHLDPASRKRLPGLFIGCVLAGVWLLAGTLSFDSSGTGLWVRGGTALAGYGLLTWFLMDTYRERSAARKLNFTREPWFVFVVGILASIAVAAAAMGLLSLVQNAGTLARAYVHLRPLATPDMFIILGFPAVMSVILVTTTIYCALMGVFEGEDDREWWARCGGAFTAVSLAWIVVHALALYGRAAGVAAISAGAGAVLGLGSSLLGFSGATAAKTAVKSDQLGSIGKFLTKHDLVLPVAGGASILLISLGMVWVEEQLRGMLLLANVGMPGLWLRGSVPHIFAALHMLGRTMRDELPSDPAHTGIASSLALFVIAGVVAAALNRAININLFSLHGMYRMRLMRAYLGASNVFRQPDPFTQFDLKDAPRQAEMPCFQGAPMHLLNATLNLTGTKNAAWRQRKAEGFSFSPVACGGWRIGYVPTPMYAGSRGKEYHERGISLATTMAISGAAANPNMGYQSSPVLSLLMTFFDLRLGCWLPNPARPAPRAGLPGAKGEDFFAKTGPSFALRPLLAEALQQTDDTFRWVELTDGGHFEDLALYEMVLRRVKHIVLVDGGADPQFGFEDLGNAVRKIQIDLGIPIEFTFRLKMVKGAIPDNRYCAVGRIRYGCVDPLLPGQTAPVGDGPDVRDGWLVYIKGCLNGSEPADILQYAKTHESFPHETTGDQFFTESQFESYRRLGSFVIQTIAKTDGPGAGDASMEDFRALAMEHWTMPQETPVKGIP